MSITFFFKNLRTLLSTFGKQLNEWSDIVPLVEGNYNSRPNPRTFGYSTDQIYFGKDIVGIC